MANLFAKTSDFSVLVKKGNLNSVASILSRVPNELERSALVNSPSHSGSTPLFAAAWDGRVEMAQLLIDNGAKINWRNLRGNTPLSMAIEQNHIDIVKLLLLHGAEGDPEEVRNIRRRTNKRIDPAIDELIRKSKQHVLDQDHEEIKNTAAASPLGQAILSGNVELVKDLLGIESAKVDPRALDPHGLGLATFHMPRKKMIDKRQALEMINKVDALGQTVLCLACAKGFFAIVKVLVTAGADIHRVDNEGRTPLHFAIAANSYSVCRYLLEAGANTYGINMKEIRYWSSSNVSRRIDMLIGKYPPRAHMTGKLKKSPVEGLSLKEFNLLRDIFDFYDVKKTGYLTASELLMRLGDKQKKRSGGGGGGGESDEDEDDYLGGSASGSRHRRKVYTVNGKRVVAPKRRGRSIELGGAPFDEELVRNMVIHASSQDGVSKGVSFHDFVSLVSSTSEVSRQSRRVRSSARRRKRPALYSALLFGEDEAEREGASSPPPSFQELS